MEGLVKTTLLLLFVTVVHCQFNQNGTIIPYERKLYDDLLKNYNTHIRPVLNINEPVNVNFSVSLVSIEDLIERDQVLVMHAWLKYIWTDPQLTWEPADYGGLKKLSLPIAHIWAPYLTLYNSVEKNIYDDMDGHMATLSPNGMVYWVPSLKLNTRCNLNMRDFPFDEHECLLLWGSWVHDSTKLNLNWIGEDQIRMDFYVPHSEWNLKSYGGKKEDVAFGSKDTTYPILMFNMTLSRKSEYHSHLYVAPSVVLALLLPSVFIIPPDSNEKITLGVGMLLAHTLMFAALEQFLPTAHTEMPKLGVYYMTNIVLTTIALFLCTLITNVWAKSQRNYNAVPICLRTVFIGILGRVFRVGRDSFLPLGADEKRQEVVSESDMPAAMEQ